MPEFTLNEFRRQIESLSHPRLMQALQRLPAADELFKVVDDIELRRGVSCLIGIIDSMTDSERASPEIIDAGRSERIARGSGTSTQSVSDLLRQFRQMKSVYQNLGSPAPHKSPRIKFLPDVCENVHGSLLAGTCPWCGCAIVPVPPN